MGRGVGTVGELLELEERDFFGLKNCGAKTLSRILLLQARYGKDITPAKPREGVDAVLANSMRYANGLIAVARAANAVIDGAKKDERSRYYFSVTTKCFNALRRTLEALGKLR